jgi:hypothetical protein
MDGNGSVPAPYDSAWNRIGSTDMTTVRDQQSTEIFAYTQIPQKFEHPQKCRNALGLVGGSEVSNISGNMVDLESELLGITRSQSKCTARQYKPACPLGSGASVGSDQPFGNSQMGGFPLGGEGCPDYPAGLSYTNKSTGQQVNIDTKPLNLPTCQMQTMPGVGYPKDLTVNSCHYQGRF